MKKTSFYGFGLLLLLTFAVINIAVLLIGHSQLFDLTTENRYTLSDETREWLTKNRQNLYFRLYKSPDLQRISPELSAYADDVLKLLEQYKLNSAHKLGLQLVETMPFSHQEEEALRLGLKKLTSANNQQIGYLGLVISDDAGNMRSIPYLNPKRRNYLEQDISRIAGNLRSNKRLDVGVLSPAFKVMPTEDALDWTPTWPMFDFLSRDYDLHNLNPEIGRIPPQLDVLLVINPNEMSNYSLYAVDQFLMRGGRVIMMLDTVSEYMINNNFKLPQMLAKSFIPDFLSRYGIEYRETTVIGDLYNSRPISAQDKSLYPFWLHLNSNLFGQHQIMEGVSSLNINTAVAMKITGQEGIKTTILAGSGTHPVEVSALELTQKEVGPSMTTLRRGENMYPVAALFEGKFTSHFDRPYIRDVEKIPYVSVGLKEGALLVITDSDWLLSETWNANTDEQQEWYDVVPSAGNLDFLLNAIDYLSPSQPPPSVASKQNLYQSFSLAQLFSQKAYLSVAKERAQIIEAQQLNTTQSAELERQIAANELMPSLLLTKRLDKLAKEKYNLQQQLQKNDYSRYRAYRFILNSFIVLCIAVSVSFVGLVVLGQWLLYRRSSRQIKGYTHE